MNKKIVAILFITAGLLLNACKKNSDIFVPDPGQLSGPDTGWYASITSTMPVSLLKNDLAIPVYSDTITVNANNAYVQTPFGLQCGFPPNCCVTSTGQTVSGTVRVDLMLIKKRGDMIRMNKPTISNGQLLLCGGQVFVRLVKDNQELRLAPNARIALKFPDSPTSFFMKFFSGDESNPQQFNWLPNNDFVNNTVGITTQNYEIQTNKLKWVSVDTTFDTAGIPQVKITAGLDPQFTNANTIGFVAFKDIRSVVPMIPDLATRKFSSMRLPPGKEVTVVVISRQGNDYFMDHKTFVILNAASSPTGQLVQVKPVITSLAAIKSYLDSL